MFAIMSHGRYQVYTTQELAEREGATFIVRNALIKLDRHLLNNYPELDTHSLCVIKDAYNQEQYSETIKLWNKAVDSYYNKDAFYSMKVMSFEINKPFW